MDLKQLEYFVCVAEQNSFTRAALALNVAQPALSRQVRLLEMEFKQALLLRTGRGVTTTDSGKLLLEYGREILYQVECLREELGRARGALVGSVTLGLPPTLLRLLAIPILDAFQTRLPEAKLSIREGLTASMSEALVSGQLDVALLYNAASSPHIEPYPLHEDPLVLVSSAAEKGMGETLALRYLPHYPLILPSRPNTFRLLIENELAYQGLRPTLAFEVDGVATMLELVAAGYGHAVLPRYALAGLESRQMFSLRVLGEPTLYARLALAVNAHRQMTATQQVLVELLQNCIAQQIGCN